MPAPGVVAVEPVKLQPVDVPPSAAKVADAGPEVGSDTVERTLNEPAVAPR